jgi:hypothetical protein
MAFELSSIQMRERSNDRLGVALGKRAMTPATRPGTGGQIAT